MRRFLPGLLLLVFTALPLVQTADGQAPAAAETSPAAQAASAAPEFTVEGAAVTAVAAGQPLWTLDFTSGSGPATVLLETDTALYVARGNSVLRVDPASGTVLWREPVSGAVTRLDGTASGISVVTALQGGLSERIQLSAEGRAQSPVRFGTDPKIFSWLREEAAVPDPAARLQQDPTNPWLYLRAGQLASGAAQQQLFEQALAAARTFYDLAGIARVLVLEGNLELAGQAMDAALLDFERRGYTPALLTDLELHEAYGFPLQPLRAASAKQDQEQVSFWARWLLPFATPEVPAIARALEGRLPVPASGAASPLAEPQSPPAADVNAFFVQLARSGWPLFAAVLIAILALQVTLTVKYWAPQGLMLRRARETGSRSGFAARFLAIRFFSTTEKLVLALLYASGLLLLGLISWDQQASALPAALRSGTLASAEALDALGDLKLTGARGDYILDFAAQTSGAAGTAAAELQPRLAAPTQLDFRLALTGTWQQAISDVFMNPWAVLAGLDFFGLPQWIWQVLLVIYLLLGLVTVLWLLVPRPRMARNAPRVLAYHVLALLVPGSGLADEAWGLLLLLPWALFAMDLAQQLLGRQSLLGVSLLVTGSVLALIYLLNLGAFLVEFSSYRRRMNSLLHSSPEVARAYGLQ
jgi:hypothetical protein